MYLRLLAIDVKTLPFRDTSNHARPDLGAIQLMPL